MIERRRKEVGGFGCWVLKGEGEREVRLREG